MRSYTCLLFSLRSQNGLAVSKKRGERKEKKKRLVWSQVQRRARRKKTISLFLCFFRFGLVFQSAHAWPPLPLTLQSQPTHTRAFSLSLSLSLSLSASLSP